MAKCDLCSESCDAHKLEQILPSYQVAGIKDICPTCKTWANKEKTRLVLTIPVEMQAAILERAGRPAPKVWRGKLWANGIKNFFSMYTP